MIPVRPFKRFSYAVLLVFLASAQSGCILLRPFGLFSESKVDAVHEMVSFHNEIPRPAFSSPPPEAAPQAPPPVATQTSTTINSQFEFKSFVDKLLFHRKKTNTTIEEQLPDLASIKLPDAELIGTQSEAQKAYCNRIDRRLSSIALQECMSIPATLTGHTSNKGYPIMLSRFGEIAGVKPTGRVLLLGGVHGDELSSISIVFEWMQFLASHHDGQFIWDVVPVMNPDGLFKDKPTRTNANGVDLNRNMPTSDWRKAALKYWRDRTGSAPRKFPGKSPASEPETRWLVAEIDRFRPDMIITVHAPHNLIDYDAPSRKNAPRQFGHLKGGLLGTFPGSLGNYAGVKRGIPVVTIELASADKAVPLKLAHDMWADMLVWLSKTIPIENKRFIENRRYASLKRS